MLDWPKHKLSCGRMHVGISGNVNNKGDTSAPVHDTVTDSSCLHVEDDKSLSHDGECTQLESQDDRKSDDSNGVKNAKQQCQENKDKGNSVRTHGTDIMENDDLIPFDDRPFKELETTELPGMDLNDTNKIAQFVASNLRENGHCVVDGIFKDEQLQAMIDEYKKIENSGYLAPGQLAGGRTSSEDKKKVVKSEIRSDKILWIEGNEDYVSEVSVALEKMDSIVTSLNDYIEPVFINGRTKAMVACYPGNGTYYRRHVDNPSKDGRVVTCILYLNNDWNVQEDGGLLRILPSHTEDYVDIPPVANRMLFFWSDSRNPHEVHPAYRTRYALTVWYFDQMERQSAKEEHINQEMSNIRGELALLDVKTKTIEKKALSQKIENEALKAVDKLTPEELEAIFAIMEYHPDPRGMLTSLGINPAIQDSLHTLLQQRKTSS